MSIKTAVIPAAGLATRSLPWSKTLPKEMLPLDNIPAIQHIVEEAVMAGIENVIIITSKGKDVVIDHFDSHPELERTLDKRSKKGALLEVKKPTKLANIVSVRQQSPRGLGHAVMCARPAVPKGEPFAVLLPDDLLMGELSGLQQVIDSYEYATSGWVENPAIISLAEIDKSETFRYGIVEFESGFVIPDSAKTSRWSPHKLAQYPAKLRRLVEKPYPEDAPSTSAVTGRYILPYCIFDVLAETEPTVGGEIQLTTGLNELAETGNFVGGTVLKGDRYDIGKYDDWLLLNLRLFMEDRGTSGKKEFSEKATRLLYDNGG